jgi:hypothetical protein
MAFRLSRPLFGGSCFCSNAVKMVGIAVLTHQRTSGRLFSGAIRAGFSPA